MTEKKDICKTLDRYISIAKKFSSQLKIAIVAGVNGKVNDSKDFSENSIKTTYLSPKEADRLMKLFRVNGFYVEFYNGFDEFLRAYYSNNFICNAVFESSPIGIAKGKDALIPAFCDSVDLLHFGPNASANLRVCNKYYWYCVLKQNNLPVPPTFFYNNKWTELPKSPKLLIKLNEECASIGLSKNSLTENLDTATKLAAHLQQQYNEAVIAQKFIQGYEVEVPILSSKNQTIVLPPVGLTYNEKRYLKDFFFDYDAVWDEACGTYLFEQINPICAEKIQKICAKVTQSLDLQGHFRIDFRVTNFGNPYITDINNDPTLDEAGSFVYSILSLGYSEDDLIGIILGSYLDV